MKQLYRKSMIEKMSDPEKLDKSVQVVSPMSWLALAGAALIIVSALVWAFIGKLPETVTIGGVIAGSENSCALFSDTTGIVSEVLVERGKFSRNDTIIRVKNSSGGICDVKAAEDGEMTFLLCEVGTQVFSGSEIARYTPQECGENVAVCYVPVEQAQKIKNGMKILIYPSNSDQNKDGHMSGKVISVAPYAANISNMAFVVGTENQLDSMFAASGAVVEVVCSIDTDKSSENGYLWTNDRGKGVTINSGALFTAKIITDEYAPITKLFSIFDGGVS